MREPAITRALRGKGIEANYQEQGKGFWEYKNGMLARMVTALALAVEGRRGKGEEGAEAQGRHAWCV